MTRPLRTQPHAAPDGRFARRIAIRIDARPGGRWIAAVVGLGLIAVGALVLVGLWLFVAVVMLLLMCATVLYALLAHAGRRGRAGSPDMSVRRGRRSGHGSPPDQGRT